jgi:Dolichyl-phosphate-mannose-protein mannosyltransferase
MAKSNGIIISFAVIKFLVPFLFIHHEFELHRDEYLYLTDANHLAWGFIEMPPLLAVLGRISRFFGNSFYTVYFWGSLFGSLTIFLIGKIVQQLKGNAYAVFLACFSFFVSGFLRVNILFQPNILDAFFWTLSSYYIICWIDTENKKYLYYIGVCFGLGMLSKYTMSFFIISFWVSILLTSRRKWLLSRHFYFAMLIALLIALPNFIWQFTHHFPVVHHMQLLQDEQLQYLNRIQFLIDQLVITLPCCFVWIVGLCYVFFNREGQRYRVLGLLYLCVIGILLLFKGKNYYAISIYPVLLAVGSVFMEKIVARKRWKILKWPVPSLIFLLAIPFFPIALPFASPAMLEKIYTVLNSKKLGLLKWEDGKDHRLPQDFADMLGWEEMTQKVARAYQKLDSNEKAHTLLFCDNYGEAGAISFFGAKYHLPEATSDNASFLYWLPENLRIDNMILVTDDKQEMQHSFINDFKVSILADSITNIYSREKGSLIIILKGADEKFNQMFKQKIEKDKAALN